MRQPERRLYQRKNSQNILDFIVVGEDGEPIDRAMGRTLNISERGLLLETTVRLDKGQLIQIAIAMEEDIAQFTGKVIHHSTAEERNKYLCGIMITEIDEEDTRLLKKYIEELKPTTKHNLPE